jgi:papain like protease
MKIKTIILISILLFTTVQPLSAINSYNNQIKKNNLTSFYTMEIPLTKELVHNVNPLITNSISLPPSFSWKNYQGSDWTTPVKHQGNCGSCWDFAAIGTLESIIKIRENRPEIELDLSEQYVLSCLPAAANNYGLGCLGGTPYKAFYYMMNDGVEGNYANGAIPESCFPYRADDQIPCDDKSEDWTNQLIPIADCGEQWVGFDTEQNRNYVKSIIYENGPIATGINVSNELIQWGNWFNNENDYFKDPDMPWGNRLNHIIVLIGWHDDDQIQNGGYWICKNSWGTDWGYDGFFNIEYGALFTATYISWVDYIANNSRPMKPEKPIGEQQGSVNEEYIYSFVSTDPDNDMLFYFVDWGDGNIYDWMGTYESGKEILVTHEWIKKGSYNIKVKVKDIHGYESEWSDDLIVSMPHMKNDIPFFFSLLFKLQSSPNFLKELFFQFL